MKSPKGTVSLVSSNGRLQARWRWQGKRYYLSLGVTDTPKNRKLVAGKVAQIQRDLDYGEFTGDVSKYQPQAVTPKVTPNVPDLLDLWRKYREYRRGQIAISTDVKIYGRAEQLIERMPVRAIDQVTAIRDWVIANNPPNAAKRLLTLICACCRWAVQSKLLESNPFAGMAATISIPKGDKTHDEIDPFTPEERDAIIAGFEQSPYYKYYAPLVKFLFLTGCRPGEALALQWDDIDGGYITFQRASVVGQSNVIKSGLKTQSTRKFPVNRQLQALLDGIPRTHQLVFPSPTGRVINWLNFRNKAWATVLRNAGIRFRKPYQIRHSFITQALKAGLSVQDVAKLVGNSPQVIYKHYAGASRELVVPEL